MLMLDCVLRDFCWLEVWVPELSRYRAHWQDRLKWVYARVSQSSTHRGQLELWLVQARRSLGSLCRGCPGRTAESKGVQARKTQGSTHRVPLGRIAEAGVDKPGCSQALHTEVFWRGSGS